MFGHLEDQFFFENKEELIFHLQLQLKQSSVISITTQIDPKCVASTNSLASAVEAKIYNSGCVFSVALVCRGGHTSVLMALVLV